MITKKQLNDRINLRSLLISIEQSNVKGVLTENIKANHSIFINSCIYCI